MADRAPIIVSMDNDDRELLTRAIGSSTGRGEPARRHELVRKYGH
jgi:hypothetical protein